MTDEPPTPADAPLPDAPSATSEYREANGVRLHVVAAGDPDDPLVVLLHGFPEFWYGWCEHVAPLVAAGYRVLVPDQRGYNLSAKPDGVGAYGIDALSGDVAGLVATEGRDSAHVVGHDWGGLVAWDVARRYPALVDRLAILNAPHPTVFTRTIASNPRQLRKSWYLLFFQLPWLPEWTARRDDFALWVAALEAARPGAFDTADLERYRTAWRRDGAPTAMVNWYRALLRAPSSPSRERVVTPTLILWGEDDQALVPELAETSRDYCAAGTLERFGDATHWLHHEHPERVTRRLRAHLDA
ncbi:alpha/beta fold hydrolase [Halarchaeum sp. P4]|uniref:alpha/beta fold hydrolase n=1 Tax=Halarchaeum sp. P4 TaxID=3421639 RepID=UPI003EBD173A